MADAPTFRMQISDVFHKPRRPGERVDADTVYAKVSLPENDPEHFYLLVRVREASGDCRVLLTEQNRGDIRHLKMDEEAIRLDPLRRGMDVPSCDWFPLWQKGEHADRTLEVEAILFDKRTHRPKLNYLEIIRPTIAPPTLWNRFEIKNFNKSHYNLSLGDLTGKGRLDLLFTEGASEQAAYGLDGSTLWEFSDPTATEEDVISINTLVPIYDIDGDGREEVITPRKIDGQIHLCIVDGRTGAVKRSTPLPPNPANKRVNFNMLNVQIANLSGGKRPAEILASWHFGCLTAYDSRLNLLWHVPMHYDNEDDLPVKAKGYVEPGFPFGFGHTPCVEDLNGDGRDEIVAGATLLDADGRILWNRKDLPRINVDHNDSTVIKDINGDGIKEILLSSGCYVLDHQGRIKWGYGRMICHGQKIYAEKMVRGQPGLQLLLVDWRCYVQMQPQHVVYLLGSDGRFFWSEVAGWATPADWDGDGYKEILIPDETNITAIYDGSKKLLGRVPLRVSRAADLIGDGRDELICLDNSEKSVFVEIYENAAPNPHAKTNRVRERRKTTPEIYKYSIY